MGKVWVLDTDTKGTGARMVPLEDVLRKPGSEPPPPTPLPPAAKPRAPGEPRPRQPRRFRVVDAMTQQVLADDADAPAVLDLLGEIRSIVDVSVYVWQPRAESWRALTLGEKKVLWDARARSRQG
jgi:hypothetical protein